MPISFSSLIAQTVIFSTMLTSSGDSEQVCLVVDPRVKALSLFP